MPKFKRESTGEEVQLIRDMCFQTEHSFGSKTDIIRKNIIENIQQDNTKKEDIVNLLKSKSNIAVSSIAKEDFNNLADDILTLIK